MLDKWKILLQTADDRMLTMVRIVLGSVMFAHGAQSAFGWFGGPGFNATLAHFGENPGIPTALAVPAIAAELVGGAFLIAGLLGRLGALGISVNMIVAILLVHWRYGFFMNWTGSKAGEGFEYHILALALAAVVLVQGSGAWSVDRWLLEKLSSGSTRIPIRHGSTRPVTGRGLPGTARAFRASWMWFSQSYQRRW